MRKVTAVWLGCSLAIALAHATALAKNVPGKGYADYQIMQTPVDEGLPADLRPRVATPSLSSAIADTFHLAWYSFDNGASPDRQGWITVDLTAQLDTFFHVAGPDELDGLSGFVPLEGNHSMWCGVDENSGDPFCRWASLPGYGNNWYQTLESKAFNCDSVRFYYKVLWQSEPWYDPTYVEYLDQGSGSWVALPVNGGLGRYDGYTQMLDECFMFGGFGTETRLRFRFISDFAWSQEDGLSFQNNGAVVVDSIIVECYNADTLTASYYEDFEDEPTGAVETNDGCWFGRAGPTFGNFGALYPALGGISDRSVTALGYTNTHDGLQEDACYLASSFVWGFFDDPNITDYFCHVPPEPLQGSVRYGPDADGLYLDNEIWSPLIPVAGSAGSVWQLRFLVYRDLPVDNLLFYKWGVRSWPGAAGCPSYWREPNFVYFGSERDWVRETFSIGQYIDAFGGSLTHVQVKIGASDMCKLWCSVIGSGSCHSHGPLIDEVSLVRVDSPGPQYTVRHLDLFQDNFAEDGTTNGTARADMATDIRNRNTDPLILPGDSIRVIAREPFIGLATDAFTGMGPAVYCYVSVWPPGQWGKAGLALEAPEIRDGKRYPLVDSLMHDGAWWYCFRFDNVLNYYGAEVSDTYCFDLNDHVFTPCDTICYVFCSFDTGGNPRYFSRRLDGQGTDFSTDDLWEALNSPMEFTILPAGGWKRGGDILYIDHSDDRGGPVQAFFDSAFDLLGILEQVDRFDVMAPSSNVGNDLGSRVKNVDEQIIQCYRKIIFSSGNLDNGLIGDGGAPNGGNSSDKSNDWFVYNLLAQDGPNKPGFYFTGDDIAEDWNGLLNEAVAFRSNYMNFNLITDDHINGAGQPMSPCLEAVGDCFIVGGIPDTLIAYGGCALVNDFDVLEATVGSVVEFREASQPAGQGYVLSQETPAGTATPANADTVRVILEGFDFHYISAKHPGYPHPRVTHLEHVIQWLRNNVESHPTEAKSPAVAFLAANYPNPFNPVTTIRYGVREQSHVSLRVYNVAGQLVKTLVDEVRVPQAGGYVARWDGTSNANQPVASGVYFYKLVTKGFTQTKKMVLLK